MRYRTVKRKKYKILFLPVVFALIFSAVFFVNLVSFAENNTDTSQEWSLILVNWENEVPKNYPAELTELSNGQSVDSRIYPSLQQMFNDMREQGIYPTVASGYRTVKRQKELMSEKEDSFLLQGYSHSNAKEEARKWVAEAGYSEHQTGLAVDINADGIYSTGEQVYAWLADNAWKYGFILRYPADKTAQTHIDHEPWHYRYVGKDAAAEIYEQEICLEEYISAIER